MQLTPRAPSAARDYCHHWATVNAAPDMPTIKATMEAEIYHTVQACGAPLIQRFKELEKREADRECAEEVLDRERHESLAQYLNGLKETTASAAAATCSTAASTKTPWEPRGIRLLKIQLATIEADLKLYKLTIEMECRTAVEFWQSIGHNLSHLARGHTPPHSPPPLLGPTPPPSELGCLADQVKAQGESFAALENDTAGCNKDLKEVHGKVEELHRLKGADEGPQEDDFATHGAHRHVDTPEPNRQRDMACLFANIHSRGYGTPHPHVDMIPQPYVHSHVLCAAPCVLKLSEPAGYHPPPGSGPPSYDPPNASRNAEFNFSAPPPPSGYAHLEQPYSSSSPQAHRYSAGGGVGELLAIFFPPM